MRREVSYVVEDMGLDSQRRQMSKVYKSGEAVMTEGFVSVVEKVEITDEFGQFHAEVYIKEFGKIWIFKLLKIVEHA